MKSKRKLLILVLVMMFIMVSVVATIALIFAATQQTITTTLNMTYTAENIYGSVKGSYTIGGVTEKLTASTGGEDLVFRGEPLQNGTLSFPTEQIDMTSEASEMILQYTFTNSGRRHYIATMSFESVIEPYNMKIQYSIDGDVYSDQRYAVVVQDESTRSYWIKISVDNKADNASFKGDFIWNLEDTEDMDEATYLSLSTLEFQGSDGAYSASISEAGDFVGAITFPSEVNGDKVTTITKNYDLTQEQKNQVTSVYIPDSVSLIKDEAFYNYQNLHTVTFEQNDTAGSVSAQSSTGLQTIELSAFYGCKNLTEFTVPNTVKEIQNSVFKFCAIKELILPKTLNFIGEEVLGSTNVTSLSVESGNSTYHSINNCVIETATGKVVLLCNTSELPNDGSIKSFAYGVFWSIGIKNVVIPDSVTDLGDNYVLFAMLSLTNLTIGSGVTSVGSAIDQCPNLKNITLNTMNSKVLTAVKGIINTNGDVNLTIGSAVTSIPTWAFNECTGLKTVVFEEGCTELLGYTFSNCSNLKSVKLPNTLTTMEHGEDFSRTAIECVEIPASVKTLGLGTFGYNNVLKEVKLNEGIESLGGAFEGASALTKINIPASLKQISAYDFSRTNITQTSVAAGHEKFICVNNHVIDKTSKTLVIGANSSAIPTDADIVTTIGARAFDGREMTTIIIPANITKMYPSAFDNVDLTEIHFENKTGWTTISQSNFQEVSLDVSDPEAAAQLFDNYNYSVDPWICK